ncbi:MULTISPECIES: phage tail protein I [Pseudomonas]|uniref:phage tail protein I n=1 Tax=Pseudomonas TaxID=286 RepID=UPI000B353F37|nr:MULTISPECIES: phage tail protein I [Pseudomonas]PMY63125.1 phage tail protein I [Pseudomonas sp. FW305-25]PMY66025.1 phage tail protein I [Pseudomonas sp. FW126-L8]PNA73913.1 phage tail protein I [Pseudomonas sp. FW305-76]
MKSLLPLNSTPLERGIEVATEEVTEIPLRTLYNPATCPAHLLYQLAWAWSVDRWDDSWSEAVKRSAIASSFYIHAHKGTIGALRRVVEPLGYLIEVVEWWQTVPEGVPGTFALKVGVLETGITEEMYRELERLIDDAKPVSRQLTGLDIILESRIDAFVGVAIYDGDEIDVYPWNNPDIDMVIQGYSGVSVYTLDELDMYPYG